MKTSFSSLAGAGLLAAFGTLFATVPASAQSFYGVTYFDGQFLTVDGPTGTAAQTGSVNAGVKADGLAAYGGGYYTYDTATNSLLQLNPATGGTKTSVAVTGITGSVAPGGLAISSAGLAYLAVPNAASAQSSPSSTVYTFSLTGGSAQTLGTTNDLLSSLAFGPNGTLYGLGKGDGELYTLNTANGSGTVVGSLGSLTVPDPLSPTGTDVSAIDSDPIGALAFNGGKLYASADGNLYTVSTTTGAAAIVDLSNANSGLGGGFSSVSGLAAAPVPEASSVISFGALLALGGLFLLRRRKPQA